MGVIWTESADKHRIPRSDILYALSYPERTVVIEGREGEKTMLYIGHPHAQTEEYIEVIVALREPNQIKIFHAMPLRDMYRHLIRKDTDHEV